MEISGIIIAILWAAMSLLVMIEYAPYCKDLPETDKVIVGLIFIIGGPIFTIANVLEAIEEKLPIKPFTEEYKGIEEFRNKKIFMFSDIQKIIAVVGALFFFAVFVTEFSPLVVKVFTKILNFF